MTSEPKVASLEEIRRSWTLVDVVRANEVLDVKREIEFLASEKGKGA